MTWQPVAAQAVDIELWATGYLRTALAARPEAYVTGVKVGAVVPPTMPTRFVQVRRDGGFTRGVIDRARVAVRCWAATEKDATDLALIVNALLFDAPGNASVLAVSHQSGPLAVGDPSGKPQRYSLVEITTRVEVLS